MSQGLLFVFGKMKMMTKDDDNDDYDEQILENCTLET